MIGLVVVVYSNYPEALFESCLKFSNEVDFRWYLYFHGNDPAIEKRLLAFANNHPNVMFFPYGSNRGLAQSWNDALRFSEKFGDEFAIILNDDLAFRGDGFPKFVDYVRALPDGYGMATVMGMESENSPVAGKIVVQQLACCVIGKAALNEIGYFDQNFSPAYFEDTDYVYRLENAHLKVEIDERILVDHDRSTTLRTNPELKKQIDEIFGRNERYFRRKWGGNDILSSSYKTPFDKPEYTPYISFQAAVNPYPAERSRELNEPLFGGTIGLLDDIGRKHGTHRSSIEHSFLFHYERILGPKRETVKKILEIAIGQSQSALTWEEYFPNSHIYSVDKSPQDKHYHSPRCTSRSFDPTDALQLSEFCREFGPFDFIVDNGSHVWSHQILSLQILFPQLRPGGSISIENIDTSYGEFTLSFGENCPISTSEYLKKLNDKIVADSATNKESETDMFIRAYAPYIQDIVFFPRGCIITRKP
ncbi:hypothetical protein JK222_04685 [Gluconobacter cerinus]|uniref:glycosyltransferase family 2 protein n=1 Tax=Gluconobacter cerinus TaxID=38307 RepID=UPI001B8B1460|nr:hypothetical protein [Gluconobacter cerinus]MBS1071002.1 hypothetical protein [Gluconobacter cerinus]